MSFLALTTDGSGKIGVRVSIEGFPLEPVSDASMVCTTADGRRRVQCLEPAGNGLVLEQRVNIPEATVDVTSNRITMVETEDEDLSQVFNASAEVETELAHTVLENNFQLPVATESGFGAGSVVHLGTEAILLSGVGPGLLYVSQRAYWDTVAQAHYSDDSSVGGGFRIVSSAPLRVRGRRVRIFIYGEGDDPLGDGTQVWLGKATSEPQLDSNGTSWSFSADNVAAALRTKIGSELEGGIVPRGAYYHWACPCQMNIIETAGSLTTKSIVLIGFFEDNVAFMQALQAKIDVAMAGADSVYTVVADDDAWTIAVTIGASTTAVAIHVHSPIDGMVNGPTFLDADGVIQTTFAAGDVVYLAWVGDARGASAGEAVAGGRRIPRGYYNLPPENTPTLDSHRSDPTFAATFPENRIYLAAPTSTDWTAAQVKWGDGGDSTSIDINATNQIDNWIELRHSPPPGHLYTSEIAATFKTGRTIAVGSLADFIQNLTAQSPRFANRLTLPAIWSADFTSMADIRAILGEAGQGRAFLSHRIYSIFSAQDVDKFISHHLRLLNCFPILETDGTISFRRFEVPNVSTAASYAIDDEVWQETLATLAPEDQGVYNQITIKTGYDAVEDKHSGRTFDVTDARAFAEEQALHPLEIAPQSIDDTGGLNVALTDVDATTIADAILGYFATPYKVVQGIGVSWQLFGIRCGDTVAINSEYLPSFDGLRPMSEVVGVVVAQRWELGNYFGTLDVLVSSQNIAGYAPSAYIPIGSFTNVSGNTWDIVIATGRYAPPGYTEDQFFIAGDAVRLIEYDSETPTEKLGSVVSVDTTTHTIRVTFTTSLTNPGLDDWWLAFQSYSAQSTAQRLYCVIAEANGTIGGDVRARTYSP